MQWHQLDHMQTIFTLLQTYYYYYYAAFNTPCVGHKDDELQAQDKSQAWMTKPSPHRSIFYKPYALPDAQPTASKH